MHTFTATETDAASQTSAVSAPAFTVDVDPNAPAITAVVGQPVNGGTVELTGTGERGDTINLYADGGTTIVGTATVASGGTFDITTTADFADGVHTFTATETDAASQTSAASAPAFTVDVDPNAPAITAVVGQPVNGGTVELTGTGERGDTINLYADGGTTIVGTATVASGGTFDITTTADFADGVHTFTATETDAASQTSAASAPAFTVDVDPNAPAITAVVGQPVNGGTVELTGTGERGDTINLYADGGTTIVGTATVASGGTFDITTTADFADGVHTFTATETDAASQTSAASAPAFTVDVDPNAPAITAVVGQPVNGGTVELTGTGERGDTINLYADGGTTIVGTATVASGGTFDITTTADFADGVHTFTATETDAASQTSAASAPAFTVDVAAMTSFSGGTINYKDNDNVGYTGPQISGDGDNTLTLTNNKDGEYGSWFNNNTYSINAFTASFDYQASGQADGMAFILQDSSAGSSALGGPFSGYGGYGGSGLGYAGISPSAAVEFNMYNSGTPGHVPGTNFATDGSTGTYDPTSDIPFGNGDEIQVVLSYNGSVLTETLTDITDGANYGDTYSINYTENLAQILGSTAAYVGFSAATGAEASTQTVSNFNFEETATATGSFTIANGTSLEFGSFVTSGRPLPSLATPARCKSIAPAPRRRIIYTEEEPPCR